ncbi:DNA-binding MarR family transcriptional regulator [Arthrobacter pascens]|uniref:MarR family winged helix-turn-helix transcriptional regulator n=1 Tax=Arthrobacter pascens TaxID=1677 RepID=UPI00278E16F6|nr:MarR family transcriptional regulator [Arthrobacter pascens]MDQ0679761.1 DNA-binding MarR family transcriptional regulator [Arthrobacter pascens]
MDSSNLSSAWSQVAAVVGAVDAALGKWLTDTHNIGLTDYHAALHLSKASDRELRINELAQRVHLNQSSATRLVGRLEAKGLASRDTCPDDRRGVYAVITDHGVDVVNTIRESYETKLGELLRHADQQHPHLNLAGLDRAFDTIRKLVA